MRVGFTYGEALSLPVGELMDYIAIEQIKNEGARRVDPNRDPLDAI